MITILDCYTDEPSGLGVPPYLGVYPRYIYGMFPDSKYITIDDLRLLKKYDSKIPEEKQKTKIKVLNLSKNYKDVENILENSKKVIVIVGAHTPGKYLSAVPGTLKEVNELLKDYKFEKVLAGPASSDFGDSFTGGKFLSKKSIDNLKKDFEVLKLPETYKELEPFIQKGTDVCKQVFEPFIAEIETAHGCNYGKCSFCTEPLKFKLKFREQKDIISEVKKLRKYTPYFRLGKQSCFFSYKNGNKKEIEKLLKPLSELKSKVLHIDNVNPAMVTEDITKLVVKYCTEGNVAAFGVESFDEEVIKKNCLNSSPEIIMKAIRIINKYGKERGGNGLPKLLPGINILMGLIGETKKTLEINFDFLKKILDEDLLIRRINIRQVVPFIGTKLYDECGVKFLKKNKKYYWKFRNKVRQEVDLPMLKKILPEGTIVTGLRTEIHDGNTTFARHFGSYPLIVGIKERLALNEIIDVKIVNYMLRSVVGERIKTKEKCQKLKISEHAQKSSIFDK